MTNSSILIAGVGNIFLGDDGFGCEVLKRLNERGLPENVRAIDFGIRGFDLACALLDGFEMTILVDATPQGGIPGTVYTIEPNLDQIDAMDYRSPTLDPHGMNPVEVLRMVSSLGGEFKKVLLVGCEPETFGPEEGQMGLSETVQRSVETAVNVIDNLVSQFLTDSDFDLIHEQRGTT